MQRRVAFLLGHELHPERTAESLDAIMVAGAFDQLVTLVFHNKAAASLNRLADDPAFTHIRQTIETLPDYGVDECWICVGSDAETPSGRKVTLPLRTNLVTDEELSNLLAEQHAVLVDT